jgi:hypothetical protein
MPKVIYDQLNFDSLVPTSMHLQLADQLIRRLVGIAKDIPVRIKNSFIPVNFVVLEMDVCCQILLILGRPFLSTARATIDCSWDHKAQHQRERVDIHIQTQGY